MADAPPSLAARIAVAPTHDPASIVASFLAWVRETGLEPYPEQLQALRALADGHHVVLATPTGSGKSLVALGAHFLARSRGERSFYTSPTKALANQKFFDLCRDFGAEGVGMLTGDASINHEAPVICCTAEVLSNMCLRQGALGAPPVVVMDEFHFYGDRQRGVAWQIPLLTMTGTLFLLMSATFGSTDTIAGRLRQDTGRDVVVVASDRRPAPLDYVYRETPLHETVRDLLARQMAPVYVVSFSQRGAAEVAQSLTSAHVVSADAKRILRDELASASFDTPYGRDLRRMLGHGVGLHHAGLLPRYRLLVEELSQRGLLKVVSGTDTLGVGVNIPIRTVLFQSLVKYDGERLGILSARAFHQIAGRAGRKGFDDRGSVVLQAPPQIIEAKRRRRRTSRTQKRRGAKKPVARIQWSSRTLDKLIAQPPEPLVSRFKVDYGMVLAVLQRQGETAGASGYAALVDLVLRCHEDARTKQRLLRDAAGRFRALRRAGLIHVRRSWGHQGPRVDVDPELQVVFSLRESLSLYLVDAVMSLDRNELLYHLRVVSLAEAILEDPVPILLRQERVARTRLLKRLKAQGVPYDERTAMLASVTYPQPEAEFIRRTYPAFAATHPWAGEASVRPKSIAREMLERHDSFSEYVRGYGIQRSEGLLLRHLSRVYDTLVQTVPDAAKTDAVRQAMDDLRSVIRDTDSSLIDAWEHLRSVDSPSAETSRPGAGSR